MPWPQPLPPTGAEARFVPRVVGPPPPPERQRWLPFRFEVVRPPEEARTAEAVVEVPAAGAYLLTVTWGEGGRARFTLRGVGGGPAGPC